MRSRLLKLVICFVCMLAATFQTTICSWIINSNRVDLIQVLPSPTAPIHLTIPVIGIDHDIVEYTDDMVSTRNDSVRPTNSNDIAWWSGGGCPGATLANTSDSQTKIDFTTFLYGHSTNEKSKIIFDDIDLLKLGDKIFVTTSFGRTLYVVEEVFVVDKTDFETDSRVLSDIPGRLLLISCWRASLGMQTTTENVVVVANIADEANQS